MYRYRRSETHLESSSYDSESESYSSESYHQVFITRARSRYWGRRGGKNVKKGRKIKRSAKSNKSDYRKGPSLEDSGLAPYDPVTSKLMSVLPQTPTSSHDMVAVQPPTPSKQSSKASDALSTGLAGGESLGSSTLVTTAPARTGKLSPIKEEPSEEDAVTSKSRTSTPTKGAAMPPAEGSPIARFSPKGTPIGQSSLNATLSPVASPIKGSLSARSSPKRTSRARSPLNTTLSPVTSPFKGSPSARSSPKRTSGAQSPLNTALSSLASTFKGTSGVQSPLNVTLSSFKGSPSARSSPKGTSRTRSSLNATLSPVAQSTLNATLSPVTSPLKGSPSARSSPKRTSGAQSPLNTTLSSLASAFKGSPGVQSPLNATLSPFKGSPSARSSPKGTSGTRSALNATLSPVTSPWAESPPYASQSPVASPGAQSTLNATLSPVTSPEAQSPLNATLSPVASPEAQSTLNASLSTFKGSTGAQSTLNTTLSPVASTFRESPSAPRSSPKGSPGATTISPVAQSTLATTISPVASPGAQSTLNATLSPVTSTFRGSPSARSSPKGSPGVQSTLATTISPVAQSTLATTISPVAQSTLATTISPGAQSPLAPTISPVASPGAQSPLATTISPVASPGARSPLATTISQGAQSTLATTKSQGAQSTFAPTKSPGAQSPLATTISPVASPGARSPLATTISPGAQSPLATTMSPGAQSTLATTKSQGAQSTLATTISPGAQSTLNATLPPVTSTFRGSPSAQSSAKETTISQSSVMEAQSQIKDAQPPIKKAQSPVKETPKASTTGLAASSKLAPPQPSSMPGPTDRVSRAPVRATSGTLPLGASVTPSGDTIVCDNGSGVLKAGLAGEKEPRVLLPSLIGRPRMQAVMLTAGTKDCYVGDEAQRMRGVLALRFPMRRGVVVDWDDAGLLWKACFASLGGAQDRNLLITECPLNPRLNRERMMETVFEKFGVAACYVAVQAVLCLYAAGATTGLVVDCGDDVTHTVPVYEGYCLPHVVSRLNMGGRDLTSYVTRILTERGVTLATTAEFEIARDIKERLGFVAADFEAELSRDVPTEQFTLPDGQVIELGNERFRCAEPLFTPALIGVEGNGIAKDTFDSIMRCDIDLRKDMFSNILLAGGSSCFPGMDARLNGDVSKLTPPSVTVRCVPPTERREQAAWLGGSVLGAMEGLAPLWIQKQEYEEFGPKIVHRKCF